MYVGSGGQREFIAKNCILLEIMEPKLKCKIAFVEYFLLSEVMEVRARIGALGAVMLSEYCKCN